MPVLDPFAGAAENSEEQKRGLLEAIAQGGAAGRQEYENAQAQVNKQRQGALDWAAQRARLTGQDLGGANTAPVTESADRFGTYFAGQNDAFQNNLQNIGSSASSYLAKIAAIAPFIQAENQQKASEREQQLKMAIAANQQKIDAEKAAALQQQQFELQKLAKQNEYKSSAASAKAKKPPTSSQILGMAEQYVTQHPGLAIDKQTKILGGPRMKIGPAVPGTDVAAIKPQLVNVSNIAGQLAEAYGVPPSSSFYPN